MKQFGKVGFYTLGCKVNQYETNAMIEQFLSLGYEIVEFNELADIYIVNTCTVTNMSDRKSRQIIKRVKQINPDALLVVTGCYAQIAKEEIEEIKDVDIILGVKEKKDILKYIKLFDKTKKKVSVEEYTNKDKYLEFGKVTYSKNSRAVIKIQDGCDMFCSYCIIPYARGRVRSRNIKSIIKEVEQLVNIGIKEVVLTGIHIASYGKDLENKYTLIDLLEELNKIGGLERIRLGSLESSLITKKFVDRLKSLDKICHHFHLSLQSGSNVTLKRMNRKYTTEQFRESVNLLKSTYGDVIITTDIIVGFPGETKKEFEETYKFLSQIKLYKMHVFKYSKRKGTIAYNMENQIDGNVKEERSNILLELSGKNTIDKNKEYVGEEVEVLFEEEDGKYIKGHTQNYILVRVKSNDLTIKNTVKKVKITKLYDLELIGNLI